MPEPIFCVDGITRYACGNTVCHEGGLHEFAWIAAFCRVFSDRVGGVEQRLDRLERRLDDRH